MSSCSAPPKGMSRVLGILRSLYPHVLGLEEFADSVVFKEGTKAQLIAPTDSLRFQMFVRGVFVCSDSRLQQVPSCAQICSLPELLAFVLNRLRRRRQRNVLAHGYGFLSLAQEERDADQFRFQGDVTQSAAYVHGSDMWRKLCVRLGTDLTRHLLESCSLFLAAPPSCAFQLCGTPIYDRVSTATGSLGLCHVPPGGRRGRSRGGRGGGGGEKDEGRGMGRCRRRKRKRLDEDDEEVKVSIPCKRARTQQMEDVATGNQPDERPVTVAVGSQATPSLPAESVASSSPAHGHVRALAMLYGGRGLRGFLLNRKWRGGAGPPRQLDGRDLVRLVFFGGVACGGVACVDGPHKLPRRFFRMVAPFSALLRRHKKCPYSEMLARHCPLVEEGRGGVGSLLARHCPSRSVFLFTRDCLMHLVPVEMWGSAHNRHRFLCCVRSFLSCGKFEKLSLAELMWKVKVNDCDWLKISKTGRVPPSELAYRQRLLGQLLLWLLGSLVGGLVHACFYVTESTGSRNTLRFYRTERWALLQEHAFRAHASRSQLEELSAAAVAALPRPLVASRLRFIPKKDGMRPISRVLGADTRTRVYQGRVQDLLDVLRVCVRARPSLLGSTVWGLSDIHRALARLAPPLKDRPRPLYFVKADVSGAYESLPHSQLREVIGQVLSPVLEDVFTTRRYAKIWSDAHEGLKKTFSRRVDLMEDSLGATNMKGFTSALQRCDNVHDAILVEQHYSSDLRGRDVLDFFNRMLSGGVIQFGRRSFRQSRGVPQGSVASPLLCCLCYGHMENSLFPGLAQGPGCLMRLVDDFLLVTPDLQQAQSFLRTLLSGVPQYGLVINPHKVALNFQAEGLPGGPALLCLPPRCLFPWCGLLLDTHTLDVHPDYSSYAGLSLRYSLTLGPAHCAGQQMRRKLMGLLRLKCNTLFCDLKINSLEAVYKNIYCLVLLHACRFHACCQALPFGQMVAKNPAFFLQMIWDFASYTNHLLRLANPGVCVDQQMQVEAVDLIFCLAFLSVLSLHRHHYSTLLPPLQSRKRRLERYLGSLRLAQVRQAAHPRTPAQALGIQL